MYIIYPAKSQELYGAVIMHICFKCLHIADGAYVMYNWYNSTRSHTATHFMPHN